MKPYTILFIDADGDDHLVKMLAPDVESAVTVAGVEVTDDLFHDIACDHQQLARATEWIIGLKATRVWEGAYDQAPAHAPVFEDLPAAA